MALRLVPRLRAVIEHVDGVAFLLQAGLDETGDLPVVLNHKDAHTTSCLPAAYAARRTRLATGPIGR